MYQGSMLCIPGLAPKCLQELLDVYKPNTHHCAPMM